MPSREEIERALIAAWLLAKQDARAMSLFDLTVEGFWRSFFAAVLAAPFYAFLAANEYALTGLPASLSWVVIVHAFGYLLDWASFPLAAILLTKLVGLEQRYVPLIIANNWATVLQLALFTAVVVVALVLPQPLSAILVMSALAAVLFYRWLVARQALMTTGGIALGFVVVDLLLGLMVERITRAML